MTTPNPLDSPQETILPGRQMTSGKRQRRPGRRRRKRPTTTEATLNGGEEIALHKSKPGEPSFDYRVSAEERETLTRPIKQAVAVAVLPPQQLPNYKLNRKPYSMTRKDTDNESANSETRSDLKSLLKQAGGALSLSEVLQQKNISLADLLNKKQHALAALTKSSESTPPTIPSKMQLNSGEMMMTGEDDQETKKHRRIPMFVAMPPHVYPTEELRPPPPQPPPTIATDVHRRIPGPIVQTKPIKEVVSRIRPDFNNSKRSSTEASNATATIRPR